MTFFTKAIVFALIGGSSAAATGLRAFEEGILAELHAAETGILNMGEVPLENCKALQESGHNETGTYKVQPNDSGEFTVFCDMTLLDGGWTVIQRRVDDSISFDRGYSQYKNGFGSYFGNLWLGLEKIHKLTHNVAEMDLYIGLYSFLDEARYARYGSFVVEDEEGGYTMRIGQYEGTAGDALRTHDGSQFSTHDKDRDTLNGVHCAEVLKGGWWYNHCFDAFLNGVYYEDGRLPGHIPDGITWQHWLGDYTPLRGAFMAIRPRA